MNKVSRLLPVALAVTASVATTNVLATPEEDLKAFQAFFAKRFKEVPFEDYVNGAYALDKDAYEQWQAIEEFPPYEAAIDKGKAMWDKPFANGKSYADCFGQDVAAIRAQYPKYDEASDSIKTIESEINDCRTANGEEALKNFKGAIADLSAYIAYQGRGAKIEVKMPEKAQKWYNVGKQFYYTKRGQLNMSCADCHIYNSGNKIRTELLSPSLGQPTHFPVYRSKWGEMGTLHRRYKGCNEQVRAKPFQAQSDEYKALEFFQAYMSNGLEWNGPGARK